MNPWQGLTNLFQTNIQPSLQTFAPPSTAGWTSQPVQGGTWNDNDPAWGMIGGQAQMQPKAQQTSPWMQYWNANPDLAAAHAQNSYGMTPEQFAQTHYQNYGAAEGRTGPVVGASQGMPGQTYFAGGGPVAGDRDQAGNYVGNNPASLGGGVTDYTGMRPQPFAGGTYSGWQNSVAQQRGQLPPAGGSTGASGVVPPPNMGTINPGSGYRNGPGGTTMPGWNDSDPAWLRLANEATTTPAQSPGYGGPQVMPGINPDSATKQNPFLSTALDAFNNTQKPFDPSYLQPLASSLWNQAGQQWNDTINPSLNSGAIAAGGYGGDRAALAKGVAADRLNQSVFNSLSPQYAQGYENWANRALQGGNAAAGTGTGLEGLDLQRLLGMGGLGVQAYNADTSRQLGIGGLQNQQFGLDTQRQLGLGDLAAKNLLTEAQVAQMANQTANPQYTNPWGAALGGGLLGWQLLDSILKGQG